jgi:hypothetical protein
MNQREEMNLHAERAAMLDDYEAVDHLYQALVKRRSRGMVATSAAHSQLASDSPAMRCTAR